MGNYLLSGFFRKRSKGGKGEIQIPPMPKYKVYTALLTQTATDAPIATILENGIGSIEWTYLSIGAYNAISLNNSFVSGKTTISITNVSAGSGSGEIMNESTIFIASLNGNIQSNDYFYQTLCEIRVYN